MGRFNLQSGVGSMRLAATQRMELALHAASRVGDYSLIAHTADESALAIMRRYETTVNRAMVTDAKHVQLQNSMRWQRGHAVDFLATFALKIEPPTGKKRYESEKTNDGDSWHHSKITLKPANAAFAPIVLTGTDEQELQVVAELVEVMTNDPDANGDAHNVQRGLTIRYIATRSTPSVSRLCPST